METSSTASSPRRGSDRHVTPVRGSCDEGYHHTTRPADNELGGHREKSLAFLFILAMPELKKMQNTMPESILPSEGQTTHAPPTASARILAKLRCAPCGNRGRAPAFQTTDLRPEAALPLSRAARRPCCHCAPAPRDPTGPGQIWPSAGRRGGERGRGP